MPELVGSVTVCPCLLVVAAVDFVVLQLPLLTTPYVSRTLTIATVVAKLTLTAELVRSVRYGARGQVARVGPCRRWSGRPDHRGGQNDRGDGKAKTLSFAQAHDSP